MTEIYSKSRQQAEIAFGNAQSQFLARERAQDELDIITSAREEKTSRLREARLAKEQQDLAAANGASGSSMPGSVELPEVTPSTGTEI